MNENTFPIELDCEDLFIYCGLESVSYTAGDRVVGEVYLNIPEDTDPLTLMLKSTGFENLDVKKPNGEEKSYSNEIFHMSTLLNKWEEVSEKGQYSFPFTFKLPYFSPANFEFRDQDTEGNCLHARIWYELTVSCEDTSGVEQMSKKIPMTILNNKTRSNIPQSTASNHLSTCFCLKRANSSVNLMQSRNSHPNYGENLSFRVEVLLNKSKGEVIEVNGSAVYTLQLQLPGDRTYEFLFKLKSIVPSTSFLERLNTLETLTEFDVDFIGDFAKNASSNSTAMINSFYTAEASVVYKIGMTRQASIVSVPVHVNPKPEQIQEVVLPEDWKPLIKSIHNVTLRNRSGCSIASPVKKVFYGS